jgi:hypothetical protein
MLANEVDKVLPFRLLGEADLGLAMLIVLQMTL